MPFYTKFLFYVETLTNQHNPKGDVHTTVVSKVFSSTGALWAAIAHSKHATIWIDDDSK